MSSRSNKNKQKLETSYFFSNFNHTEKAWRKLHQIADGKCLKPFFFYTGQTNRITVILYFLSEADSNPCISQQTGTSFAHLAFFVFPSSHFVNLIYICPILSTRYIFFNVECKMNGCQTCPPYPLRVSPCPTFPLVTSKVTVSFLTLHFFF